MSTVDSGHHHVRPRTAGESEPPTREPRLERRTRSPQGDRIFSALGVAAVAALTMGTGLLPTIGFSIVQASVLAVPIAAAGGWFFDISGAVVVAVAWIAGWGVAMLSTPSPAIDALAATLLLSVIAGLAVALKRTRDNAIEASETDSLTGLLNRRGFLRRIKVEALRSQRFGHGMTVLYIDCDRFKQFNDTRGHLAGDRLLQELAHCLEKSVRGYDLTARLGGDEFALLLPEASAEGTHSAAARIQSAVRRLSRERDWPIDISLGAAFFQQPRSPEEMLDEADKLMYECKREDVASPHVGIFRASAASSNEAALGRSHRSDVIPESPAPHRPKFNRSSERQ